MSKYIDAEKLIAEIESRMGDCQLPNGKFPTTTTVVRYEELSCLRNFITSLQQEQPKVDLEKEIEFCWKRWLSPSNQKEVEGILPKTEFEMYARHFAEWGAENKAQELRGEVAKVKTKIWQDGFDDGYATAQKEQPKADLEKEIDELWKSLNTGHEYVIVRSYQDFLGICLHCFELGLNTRKED